MKILVVGAGKVGYTIASVLSKEKHDVTLLDTEASKLKTASDRLDVQCVQGSGTSIQSLLEAGVEEADLLIAVTDRDEVNMLCCLTGKRKGARHTIARIRDLEYTQESGKLQSELGLDMVINPEQQTAMEISRILRFPAAISIDPFVSGRIELVAYRILKDDPLIGVQLKSAMVRTSEQVLFCFVERGGELMIPGGNTALEEGDVAYIIGQGSQISSFFHSIGRKTHGVKNTMIIGGGRICRYLAENASRSGIRVKIIEKDKNKCRQLNEELDDCFIVNGDGTDINLLESENLQDCESAVFVTGNDEENAITALYARHVGVQKVVVKMSRDEYIPLLKGLEVDTVVIPKNITAVQIVRYVRAMENSREEGSVEMLYSLAGGKGEALQFTVDAGTRNLDIPFMQIAFKPDVLVAAIHRGSRVLVPSGRDCLKEGDKVIVVSLNRKFLHLNEIFA